MGVLFGGIWHDFYLIPNSVFNNVLDIIFGQKTAKSIYISSCQSFTYHKKIIARHWLVDINSVTKEQLRTVSTDTSSKHYARLKDKVVFTDIFPFLTKTKSTLSFNNFDKTDNQQSRGNHRLWISHAMQ